MPSSSRETVKIVSAIRGQSVIFGLTGRTGSGCSTACKLLCSQTFHEIKKKSQFESDADRRKYEIVGNFLEKNWHPFQSISLSSIISSFVITSDETRILQSINPLGLDKSKRKTKQAKATRAEDIACYVVGTASKIRSDAVEIEALLNSGKHLELDTCRKIINFYREKIPNFHGEIKNALAENSGKILQQWGDNLRLSGSATSDTPKPEKTFEFAERICRLVLIQRRVDMADERPTRIVLDALRNPFELGYIKERIPGFLVIGITTNDEQRKHRLALENLPKETIDSLDEKEYPQKRNRPLEGYKKFASQDIQACLEKSDIFINNPGQRQNQDDTIDTTFLAHELCKYLALRIHPGLVTPTRDERCMQIAFVSRANSGCISRQVGAVVTDEHYSVKAVGWNDIPEGQIPCLLRDVRKMLDGSDTTAFSEFECRYKPFRTHVEGKYANAKLASNEGMPCPYCFKDNYNEFSNKENQVHTRSLHAEENAFLQISKYGGQGLKGGVLFSTASPCELCAKKAFQLGVTRIVYVDPYPGISKSHVLGYGPGEQRPTVELFSGAVGLAYHRLYDPALPIKDELKALMSAQESGNNDLLD